MRLMRIEICLAFADAQRRKVDHVANELVRYAIDGQEAGTGFTAIREQQEIDYPDIKCEEANEENVQAWQDHARDKLQEMSRKRLRRKVA